MVGWIGGALLGAGLLQELVVALQFWPVGQPHRLQLLVRTPLSQYFGFEAEHAPCCVPSAQFLGIIGT
jgi:hypothetical protein